MSAADFRIRLGVLIVGGHFLLIAATFVLGLTATIKFQEALELLALIVPLFAAYGSVVWAHLLAKATATPRPATPIAGLFVVLAFSLVAIALLLALGAVVAKVWNWVSLGESKAALAAIETSFGAYLGPMVKSLFK